MNAAALIAFHIEAKTPLKCLANSVRWFEEAAKHPSNKAERGRFALKAKMMRVVISQIYAHRDITGEYAEQTIAA